MNTNIKSYELSLKYCQFYKNTIDYLYVDEEIDMRLNDLNALYLADLDGEDFMYAEDNFLGIYLNKFDAILCDIFKKFEVEFEEWNDYAGLNDCGRYYYRDIDIECDDIEGLVMCLKEKMHLNANDLEVYCIDYNDYVDLKEVFRC